MIEHVILEILLLEGTLLTRLENIVVLTLNIREDRQTQHRLVQTILVFQWLKGGRLHLHHVIPINTGLMLADGMGENALVQTLDAGDLTTQSLDLLFNGGAKSLAIALDLARVKDEYCFILCQFQVLLACWH